MATHHLSPSSRFDHAGVNVHCAGWQLYTFVLWVWTGRHAACVEYSSTHMVLELTLLFFELNKVGDRCWLDCKVHAWPPPASSCTTLASKQAHPSTAHQRTATQSVRMRTTSSTTVVNNTPGHQHIGTLHADIALSKTCSACGHRHAQYSHVTLCCDTVHHTCSVDKRERYRAATQVLRMGQCRTLPACN